MPALYQLYREQTIQTDLETAWEFISSPRNLDAITPDDMPFEIITHVPDKMYDGLLIEYKVGIPLFGKQTWLTEIKHICEHHSFVDEQRIGPYKLWYHYHEVSQRADGIRFIDSINYVLPMGVLGSIAHGLYVKKQLQAIFDYREGALAKHFKACLS